jgi:hypothetical protein
LDYVTVSGLPDGIFSNKGIQIWVNFGGLWNGKGGIFFHHLEYIMAFWYILYILWPVGNLVAIWYIFSRFVIFCQKIWQPCTGCCQFFVIAHFPSFQSELDQINRLIH